MKIKTNKYLDFIKFLFAKIFKKEYNITVINETDKKEIRELYFENLKDFEEIKEIFKNKYTYDEIRNYIISTLE